MGKWVRVGPAPNPLLNTTITPFPGQRYVQDDDGTWWEEWYELGPYSTPLLERLGKLPKKKSEDTK